MIKACCCTGHRPQNDETGEKYYAYLQAIEDKIERVINEYGVTHFISAMAYGMDTDFAEAVLRLRDKYPAVTLECAFQLPYETLKWNFSDKDRVIKNADVVKIISKKCTSKSASKHMRYMVDKSEVIITAFNGLEFGTTWKTLNYAKEHNKIIEMIDLCNLK